MYMYVIHSLICELDCVNYGSTYSHSIVKILENTLGGNISCLPTRPCVISTHTWPACRSGCRSISALASPGLCLGVLGELNPGLKWAEPILGEVTGSGFSMGERYCHQYIVRGGQRREKEGGKGITEGRKEWE